jgi:oxygen-independent coproporphyrinogen III oxidase
VLSDDDLLRRDVIQRLMCDFALDLPALSARWRVDAAARLAPELARLADLERDGLLTLGPERIEVSAKGRLLIRNVCMVFDGYFGKPAAAPLQRMQYSRTV